MSHDPNPTQSHDEIMGVIVAGLYRIEQPIGRGGFANVYMAERLETGEHVAIKILDADHRHHRVVSRFLREKALLRRISHPSILTIIDAGTCHVGPYIVSELLIGATLRQHLGAGHRFTTSETARLAIDVLDALEAAHQAGVIHRDIKPENLFLCQDTGRVKLLDFGIAKTMADADGDATRFTMQGELTGTIAYAPPEQLIGEDLGPWSDIFSLGLVMSELMTGRRVYGGDVIDQCMQRLNAELVPHPPLVLESALGTIIDRATTKKREGRYQNVAQMRAELLPRDSSVRCIPPTLRMTTQVC